MPGLMRVLLLAGSAYIAWIGWSILRSQASLGRLPEVQHDRSPWAVAGQAVVTCLLNPKAYLFMVAVFPQFLRVENGALWPQAARLGLIIALTQCVLYGGLACLAAQSRGWLSGNPQALVMAGRLVGVMLIAGAAYTAIQGWQTV